ncbi:MAG: hypothetical protein ACK559_15475, partial [bacterium]
LFGDAPVAEEDAGHDGRVDAVVSRPGLRVVAEDLGRDRPRRALPGVAVPALVADEQVRSVEAIRAIEDLVRTLDLAHGALARRWVHQGLKTPRDLVADGAVRLALGDDARGLAARTVDEQTGEPQRERLGARPVDVLE